MILSRYYAVSALEPVSKNLNMVMIIHYSCENFNRDPFKAPRITSIAISSIFGNQTHSFTINMYAERNKIEASELKNRYDEFERLLLDDFFIYMESHSAYYFVHWGMKTIKYGFDAIKQRYRTLGGNPKPIAESNLIDLSNILKKYYGEHYVEDPKLQKLAALNGLMHKDFLSGEDEANCFDNCEYNRMHLSTLTKVKIIGDILQLHLSHRLRTNVNSLSIFLGNIMDSAAYKITSMICILFTLISFIYGLAIYISGL